MRKAQIFCAVLLGVLAAAAVSSGGAAAQRRPSLGAVCGDPTVRCRTSVEFDANHLPFRVPPSLVISETEQFYAVILRSVGDPSDGGNCDVFVPEAERLEAQALFPRHKVFASRCAEPGNVYYTGVAPRQQFMAVYAGRTRAEAGAMLAKVRATGKYPGANLRRMRAGFNGT